MRPEAEMIGFLSAEIRSSDLPSLPRHQHVINVAPASVRRRDNHFAAGGVPARTAFLHRSRTRVVVAGFLQQVQRFNSRQHWEGRDRRYRAERPSRTKAELARREGRFKTLA